jgi:hypothetical protein
MDYLALLNLTEADGSSYPPRPHLEVNKSASVKAPWTAISLSM